MQEAIFEERRRDGAARFAVDSKQEIVETTPDLIRPEILTMCADIGACDPIFIDTIEDEFGIYLFCSDGVLKRVSVSGGECVYGWCIWEYPRLFSTVEFHAVWRKSEGILVDITPKPQGEKRILFARDKNYPSDFDFDTRPASRLVRIYHATPVDDAVRMKIASFDKAGLAYNKRRADSKSMTLEHFVETKLPKDPLPEMIDEFLAGVQAKNSLFVLKAGTMICYDAYKLKVLDRKNYKDLQKIKLYIRENRPDLR